MAMSRRPGGSGVGSSGSVGVIGISSTDSTRCRPATAVWVWSMISVNSAMGSRKRYVRNTKLTSAPAVNPSAGPRHTPTPMTADTVNTAKISPDGKRNAP